MWRIISVAFFFVMMLFDRSERENKFHLLFAIRRTASSGGRLMSVEDLTDHRDRVEIHVLSCVKNYRRVTRIDQWSFLICACYNFVMYRFRKAPVD